MTPEAAAVLRGAAAHALVDDLAVPELADDAAHHLFRVLRVRDGDPVTVTDGVGGWRPCRAVGGALAPDGDAAFVARRGVQVEVAFAVPKQDRPEWIVQKLTELGVDRIVVLHAERSVVRWSGERAAKHLAKLRRVAAEAIQQSRGVWLPEIEGPVTALDMVSAAALAEPGASRRVAELAPAADGVRRVAIGPEGGWSPAELAAAADTVRLGATVLRVETAALAAAVQLATS